MTEPKIAFYDVESIAHKAWVWGLFKENIPPIRMIESGRVICWALKFKGKSKVHFKSEQSGHKEMVVGLWNLLSDADGVVTYNGESFDNRMMNAEYVKYGLKPLPPTKQIDLYKVVKKNFRLPSYKLEYVAQHFGIGQKVKHEGFELWVKCNEGNRAAWRDMRRYNEQDTLLLEALYEKLLPYIRNHPSRSLEDHGVCTNCGSHNLQSRGYHTTKTGKFRRFQCTDCGTWQRERETTIKRGTKMLVSL